MDLRYDCRTAASAPHGGAIRRACLAVVAAAGLASTGCAMHTYVALTPGEGIRDVTLPGGGLATIRVSSNEQIVGLAYEQRTDRLFAREIPGTRLVEIERASGATVRTFSAQQVTPGCGGLLTNVELPNIACGLAMRWSDRHLFLDHPNGNPITELDVDGRFVRHIMLQKPGGPIGGLGYDQRNDRLYVLYIVSETVAEVDLNGAEIRRFRPQAPIQPQGLDVSTARRELYIPLVNGNAIGVFDLSGALIEQHPLQRAGVAGGVGAGTRPWWRR
ncbi:hypothetical protein FBR04_01885 [Betaproteobacteria bacterium PRO7]|jgi:hypothetical protein|nr:hypothetical protein [Betaproteobacteria bacterium PRO7]GIL06261.1 MAG: hypothetical protein BroJett031_27810 [Betaproteobacteria bacterium]